MQSKLQVESDLKSMLHKLVSLQGLPEDCVQVLVEPDGPHLRYSTEAVEK